MYHVQVQLFISLLMLVEALTMVACLPLAGILDRLLTGAAATPPPGLLLGMAVYMVLVNHFFMHKFGLYSERRPRTLRHSLLKIASASTLSIAVMGFTLYILNAPRVSTLFLLAYGISMYASLCLVRILVEFVLSHQLVHRFHSRRILIVGSDKRSDLIAKLLSCQRSWGHRLVGFVAETPQTTSVIYGLPRLGSLAEFGDILAQKVVDEVFFVLPDYSHDIRDQLAACEQLGVTYRIVPALYDPAEPHKLKVDVIQDVPTLTKTMVPFNPSGYIYKRIMDYTLGLAGFTAFLLMYPVVALAIRLDSPGPVLYAQPRVGRQGRTFTMYKFRTMCAEADQQKTDLQQDNEMNGAMFKLKHDPRVTRVGRVLRRTSLDEFPQFINVLRGEMSIVGTRPPTLDEVARYTQTQRRRLSIRPGITGLWQISGRNRINEFEQVVELDLAYIDNWRFWSDVCILFKTLWVVLRCEGAR